MRRECEGRRALLTKKILVRSRVRRKLHPQQTSFLPAAAREAPPHSKSTIAENSLRAAKENAENFLRHHAVTCFNCGKFCHVASACTADASCYGCGGVGHITRDCPTRASQSAANANYFTSGAVVSPGKDSTQLFAKTVIGGGRIANLLVDTGSSLSMLTTATYGRLPSALAIQPFTKEAFVVIGVGGASGEIRGYVDTPVEHDNIAVHHSLLVVDRLAFALLIDMDIFRPHGATLSFGRNPVPLRTRVCSLL